MTEKDRLTGESSILAAINSEYLVNCEEVYSHDTRIWIVLEYMNGGALKDVIL